MLADADALDFALAANSSQRGLGIDPAAVHAELQPRAEFVLPIGTRALAAPARWSPGALQR
jgi:hypothetical protein